MNVGVFFGSRSPEREVSIITANLIMKGLRALGYNVVPVYLSESGKWCISQAFANLDFYRQDNFDKKAEKFSGWNLKTDQKEKLVFIKGGLIKKELMIDIAFPAFHGAYGEDGTIQGLFEMLQVPYVGCDVASSALAMDKVLTKRLYQALNVPTTSFTYYQKSDKDQDGWRDTILGLVKKAALKFPLFVKPARLGSSIGISKVFNDEELIFGCEVVFYYDKKVIIEEAVEPLIDITCAVRQGPSGLPEPSLLQESLFNAPFLSYEEKYLKKGATQIGGAKGKGKSYQIPARLDENLTKKIRDTAVAVFTEFGCSGMARVDFLVNSETKEFFVNEVNTIPGTLYHHLWKASGVSFEKLLSDLILAAQKRFQESKNIKYIFKSDILKKAGGIKTI